MYQIYEHSWGKRTWINQAGTHLEESSFLSGLDIVWAAMDALWEGK